MRRDCIYQANRPIPDVQQRTAVLVDDGIATGSTLRAAIVIWRHQQSERIAIALPIPSTSACDALKAELTQWCIISADPLYSISF